MNLKTVSASLLAVVGVSVGAYSFWERNNTVAESAEELSRELAVAVADKHHRKLVVTTVPEICPNFGKCCLPSSSRRRLGKRRHSFHTDVVERALQTNCQTAYARMHFGQNCFTNPEENVGANRWGWRLEIDGTKTSSETFDVYAGAGQCNIVAGVKVGTFRLTYNKDTQQCSGYYVANAGYMSKNFHFYCGTAPYPTDSAGDNIVAGGQLGCQKSGSYSVTPTCSFTVPPGGIINAIAHFESCGGTGGVAPTPAPAPTPPPSPYVVGEVCAPNSRATCQSPTQLCASFGLVLCGTGCCDGTTHQYEVEDRCEQISKVWCPLECDDGDVFGDPHFRTWHQKHDFEYHGECDLVFLKAPAMDMDIHVRTTIRYDYSFVSQAAVRIGKEIFEIASWGEYQLDGMSSIDLPAFIGGHPITKTEVAQGKVKFVIHLEQDKEIVLTSFKDYVAVRIENGTMAMYEGASGIMGDFETGNMVLRDGSIETDPMIYTPEWQVRPDEDGVLFAGEREPVYPQQCVLPSETAISARARKLGEARISKEQAEAACAFKSDEYKAACIEDVLKTQDLDVVNA